MYGFHLYELVHKASGKYHSVIELCQGTSILIHLQYTSNAFCLSHLMFH